MYRNAIIRLVLPALLAFLVSQEASAQTAPTELRRQGFLGAQLAPLAPDVRTRLKLADGQQGVLVMRADAGSSAETAGLAADDVILKINEAGVSDVNGFVGAVRQYKAGDKFDLTVLRGGQQISKTVTLKPRPFETHPDFDILYRAVDTKGGRRRVIITKPKTANTKFSAVLLVGGIGCYSLDNFPPSHAYRKILYALTEQGFATMRVEKTGMGDSEGPACQSPQADLRQEVDGYVAGLNALKGYDFVDADKTFIFGHSIGGIVGPLVAAESPVRGMIVVATVGTNWFEYGLENFRRQALLRGMPYDELETMAALNRTCKQRSWQDGQSPDQVRKENPACGPLVNDPASHTYMQGLTKLNLAETWKKSTAPTLIMYGSSDFLTSTKEHEYLRSMISTLR